MVLYRARGSFLATSRPSSSPPPSDAKLKAISNAMNYHRRADILSRGRIFGLCSGLLLAGALGAWIVAGDALFESKQARFVVSPGQLSSVHSNLNYECAECHKLFHPVHDQTAASWVACFFSPAKALTADSMDDKCQACHKKSGQHHARADDIGHCATCHQEHQGEHFDVAATTDQTCTQCHANLKEHIQGLDSSEKEHLCEFSITTFQSDSPGSHPEFDVVRLGTDNGKLKFNHAQHLQPGIPELNANSNLDGQIGSKKESSFDKDFQDFYQSTMDDKLSDPNALVELQCKHCHQPDLIPASSTEGTSPLFGGRYMLPVTYENHCRTCHPLDVPAVASQGRFGPDEDPETPAIPHGRQPSELREFVRDALTGIYARSKPAEESVNKVDPNQTPEQERLLLAEHMINTELEVWLMLLTNKTSCLECHHVEGKNADGSWPSETSVESVEMAAYLSSMTKLDDVRIVPTAVEKIWMPRARFDHFPHRNIKSGLNPNRSELTSESQTSCYRCHAGAWSSQSSDTLLLPSIKICQECHASLDLKKSETGVASNCTECHGYHDGQEPSDSSNP